MTPEKKSQWVTLKSFNTTIEAHLARGMLESEGVEAVIRDEHTISIRPYLSQALGGVRLDVLEEDFERARELLDVPSMQPEPKLCQHCGGKGIAVTDPKGNLAAILTTLFTVVPGHLLKPKFRCAQCGHEWRA
jgi:hypothetical protein